jgi:hypothetical protein
MVQMNCGCPLCPDGTRSSWDFKDIDFVDTSKSGLVVRRISICEQCRRTRNFFFVNSAGLIEYNRTFVSRSSTLEPAKP